MLRPVAPSQHLFWENGTLLVYHTQGGLSATVTVLLIHGTEDDVVAIRSMSLAETALAGAGVGVDVETHVSLGVAHSVGQDGLAAATAFAKRVVG